MKPPRDPRPREEIQDELRLRAEKATAELSRTRAECDRLDAISVEAAATSNGTLATRRSSELHREAMRQLREAMLAFEAFNRAANR